MSAPALHPVIMRRFTVVQRQFFPGLDGAQGIDLHPKPKNAHENIWPATVVQMTERVSSGAIQRMCVVQVNEAHAAFAFGAFSSRADGDDLASDLADLCAAWYSCNGEHSRPVDGAATGLDGVVGPFG